jgi:hypothetical protein
MLQAVVLLPSSSQNRPLSKAIAGWARATVWGHLESSVCPFAQQAAESGAQTAGELVNFKCAVYTSIATTVFFVPYAT